MHFRVEKHFPGEISENSLVSVGI